MYIFSIEELVTKAVEMYLAEKKALDEGRQVSGSDQEDLPGIEPLSPSEGEGSTFPIPLQPSSSVDLLVGSSGTTQENTSGRGRGKEGVAQDSITSDKGRAMAQDSSTSRRDKEGMARDSSTSDRRRGKEGVAMSSGQTATGPNTSAGASAGVSAGGVSTKKTASTEEHTETISMPGKGSGEVGRSQQGGGAEEEQVGEEEETREPAGSEISKDSPVLILPVSSSE